MGTDMTETRPSCTAINDWDIHQVHFEPEA